MRNVVIYVSDGGEVPGQLHSGELEALLSHLGGEHRCPGTVRVPDGDGGCEHIVIAAITRVRELPDVRLPMAPDREAPPPGREQERFGVV